MIQSRLSELVYIDHIFHREYGLSRLHLFLFNIQADITAYHHGCQRVFIHISHFDGLDIFTLTDDGTVIRGCSDFF